MVVESSTKIKEQTSLEYNIKLHLSPFSEKSETEIVTEKAIASNTSTPIEPLIQMKDMETLDIRPDDDMPPDDNVVGPVENPFGTDSDVINILKDNKIFEESIVNNENAKINVCVTSNNENQLDSNRRIQDTEIESNISSSKNEIIGVSDFGQGREKDTKEKENIINEPPEADSSINITNCTGNGNTSSINEYNSLCTVELKQDEIVDSAETPNKNISLHSVQSPTSNIESIDAVEVCNIDDSAEDRSCAILKDGKDHFIDESLQMDIEQLPVHFTSLVESEGNKTCAKNIKNKLLDDGLNEETEITNCINPIDLEESDLSEVLGDKTNKPSVEPMETITIMEDLPASTKRSLEDTSGVNVTKPLSKRVKKVKPSPTTEIAVLKEKRRGSKIRKSNQSSDNSSANVNGTDKKENSQPPKKSLYELYSNGNFTGLTKHGLEEMIMQKVCDYLVHSGPRGDWRHKCAQLEDERDRLNRITVGLKRQLLDARNIIKKLIEDKEASKSNDVTPMKVTRSVGLQVCTAGTFYIRPQAEFKAGKNRTNLNDNSTPRKQISTNSSNVSLINVSTENSTSIQSRKAESVQVQQQSATQQNKSVPHRPSLPAKHTQHSQSQSEPQPVMTKRQNAISTKTVGVLNNSSDVVKQPMTVVPQIGNDVIQQESAVLTPIKLKSAPRYRAIKPAPEVSSVASLENSPQLTQVQAEQNPKKKKKNGFVLFTTVNSTIVSSTSNHVSNSMEVIDLTDKDEKEKTPSSLVKVSNQSPHKPFASLPLDQANKISPNLKMGNIVNGNGVVEAINFSEKQQAIRVLSSQSTEKTENKVDNMTEADTKDDDAKEDDKKLKLPRLPTVPNYNGLPHPPKPCLRVCKATSDGGIMLSWNFNSEVIIPTKITLFELFALQEHADGSYPMAWNKVGVVKALPLPMACTLTQFIDEHIYHFAVRAVDVYNRQGPFSKLRSIKLTRMPISIV